MAKWRMTYNNRDMHGCSARGIATKNSQEELLTLVKQLKDSIYNIKITQLKHK